MKPSLLDQLPFLIVFTKGLSDSQVSVAMAADKEPVHFCTADSACEACWRKAITEMGLHAEQQHGCHTFLGALVRRGSSGSCQPGAAGSEREHSPAGADGHCLAAKGLLGATVPCHSWLPPGHCCEGLLAVLKHLQPRRLDNKVAFKAFASSPALLLFKAPCYS